MYRLSRYTETADGEKATEADAQYYIGELYLNGYGVARSKAEAMKWLLLSAKQGNTDAQEELRELAKNNTKPS